MPQIPEFMALLERMKEIHAKKNEDYSSEGNWQNFERSAQVASWFNNATDKSFVILIGTKLARLATLLNKTSAPNNESIEDSFLDLTTYCALWASYHSQNNKHKLVLQGMNAIIDRPGEIYASHCDRLTTHDWTSRNGKFICKTCGAAG